MSSLSFVCLSKFGTVAFCAQKFFNSYQNLMMFRVCQIADTKWLNWQLKREQYDELFRTVSIWSIRLRLKLFRMAVDTAPRQSFDGCHSKQFFKVNLRLALTTQTWFLYWSVSDHRSSSSFFYFQKRWCPVNRVGLWNKREICFGDFWHGTILLPSFSFSQMWKRKTFAAWIWWPFGIFAHFLLKWKQAPLSVKFSCRPGWNMLIYYLKKSKFRFWWPIHCSRIEQILSNYRF